MRKTLIALMLVLPMIFVLVIFSSVNIISLGVNISVNGIEIHAEGTDEEGTLLLDMADRTVHTVTAEVSPNNATEKGYTLTASDETVVTVTKDGVIVPKKEGTAEITATSNDKSFTDTMSVVVVSSKPYDFDFSLLGSDGENLLKETDGGYEATVPAGTYSYGMDIYPIGYTQYTLAREGDLYAEASRGQKTLFLPFSGDVTFTASVPDGIRGNVTKTILLHVKNPAENGVLINGSPDFGGLTLASGATEAQLYVECPGQPQFVPAPGITLKGRTGSGGRYIFDLEIGPEAGDGQPVSIRAGGKTFPFMISFTEFTFSVGSDRTIETAENGAKTVTVLTGNAANFYPVASAGAEDVVYSWDFSGPRAYFSEQDGVVTINAAEGGEFTLRATAKYGTHEPVTQEITLIIINKVSVVQIANNVKADLAASYVIAGMAYSDDLKPIENVYPLRVYAHSTAGTGEAGDDIAYSVAPEGIARVELRGGKPVLVPVASGEVTVTAAWKGNAAFKTNVIATLTVSIAKDAVAVKNAPELLKAMEEKRPAVLTENIRLGTDANGREFSLDERAAYLKTHRMKSTYNTEWYKHASDASLADAELSYVLEFTANVYGNGKSVDADLFTHALDANGVKPLLELYAGPRYFVKYKQMASVAGQDNCAFLIRTDGITLYGVNLLGCSDKSLMSADGGYDLTNLNLTGTTLEINADCSLINCRIRNGRNVVRAYGGNRAGTGYFVDSLTGAKISEADHINVTIDGCILSQGREFLLKMGANRALRASKRNGQEPELLDQSDSAYSESGKSNRYGDGKLYTDDWFYSRYVMTDVTLKDSVLETSGLFTIGIESNFAGEFLYEGASDHQWRAFTREWEYSGGTSFAAVLRLVGDVRLYDWKDLSLIDSSTLIESPVGALSEWLKLDIKGMLNFVSQKNPALYGDVIETTSDGKQYVHGGIALYGGGRNYSAVVTDDLNKELNDFLHLNVNISVLSDGEGTLHQQGDLLPRAAGTHDFNFYMYGSRSANNFVKQRSDEQRGVKYKGVEAVPLF